MQTVGYRPNYGHCSVTRLVFQCTMSPFLKSVLLGAAAGAAPALVFTLPLGAMGLASGGFMGNGSLLPPLWIGFLPLIVAAPLVLAASVIFGLPLTAILKRRNLESSAAYTGAGAGLGFMTVPILLLLMSAPEGYWMACLGALSGAVTGRVWWTSTRE